MKKYDAYVICTAPRSGSTLLCKLLAGTDIAGNPASWFYRPSIEDWLARLNVVPQFQATEQDILSAVFSAAIQKGSNSKGPFGLRQQAESFPFLFEKLAFLFPKETTDTGRFQRVFGATLFIHLQRSDKVDQAVSYLKAEQTGLWHVAHDGSELERVAPHREPFYDKAQISACVEMMTAYDKRWNDWFIREEITPHQISYDHLGANPIQTLRELLDRLGLDRSAAEGVFPAVKKLADRTNRDWAKRFRAEMGLI